MNVFSVFSTQQFTVGVLFLVTKFQITVSYIHGRVCTLTQESVNMNGRLFTKLPLLLVFDKIGYVLTLPTDQS